MLNHLARVAVSLVCDGDRLPEYDVKALDDKTAACYVASEAGKAFSIVYENRLSHGLLVRIHFDGTLVGSFYSAPGSDYVVSGAQISPTLERPFVFSRPALIGRDTAEGPEYYKSSYSGMIQVEFHRYAAVWECESVESVTTGSLTPVLDTSKGTGMHRIRLGDAMTSTSRPSIQGHLLDPIGNPYARFIFNYCPRETLRGSQVLTLPRPLHHGIGEPTTPTDSLKSEPNTPISGGVSRYSGSPRSATGDRPMHMFKGSTPNLLDALTSNPIVVPEMILSALGISASIGSADTWDAFEEYDLTCESNSTAECSIFVPSGKHYIIMCHNCLDSVFIILEVFIDGISMGTFPVSSGAKFSVAHHSSKPESRPLRFSEEMRTVGEIELVAKYIRFVPGDDRRSNAAEEIAHLVPLARFIVHYTTIESEQLAWDLSLNEPVSESDFSAYYLPESSALKNHKKPVQQSNQGSQGPPSGSDSLAGLVNDLTAFKAS
ncbi:hypothetical protein NM688_g7591 [Phlebia brevispora]|uniref:Uncharacterized protein n=1 Tax=Phlebia brevispora TaxID=194682 RepID=A0ACC1S3K6_9APHY|nr:hypothetical protein NM688_g7591 [Phlebia brevispora]